MKEPKAPLVSIVAACFNHAAFLEETLDSIAAQDYSNIELIITDDGSKDNSVALIKEWMATATIPTTLIANVKNIGICTTFNKGLAVSKGQYFQVVACDDVLLPHKISTQVAALETANKDVVLVHTDALVLDKNSKLTHNSFHQFWQLNPIQGEHLLEQLVTQNSILAPSILMRRAAFVALGGYDENLCYEDWDAWLRLAAAGYDFLFLSKPLVYYRHFPSSNSQTSNFQLRMAKDNIILLDKHRGRSKILDQKIGEAQRPSITLLIENDATNRALLWKKLSHEKSLYSCWLWLMANIGIKPSKANALKDKLKRK
ncbi:MAG: glycosyltransferase [Aureispira sp.]